MTDVGGENDVERAGRNPLQEVPLGELEVGDFVEGKGGAHVRDHVRPVVQCRPDSQRGECPGEATRSAAEVQKAPGASGSPNDFSHHALDHFAGLVRHGLHESAHVAGPGTAAPGASPCVGLSGTYTVVQGS